MIKVGRITNPLIKSSYISLLAILIIFISYTSLVAKDNIILNTLLYLLSAFSFWVLLSHVGRAISAKIYQSLNLIKRIDQFCFITTFGFVGLVIMMGIVYFIILVLVPPRIAIFLLYALFIIFTLLEILFSYNLARAFFDLKVYSTRQRWLCWMVGSFFLIVYPALEVSGILISFYFKNSYDFYINYPWLAYISFGLENYILIFILLTIKFF
jgi:hypothetical protein